MPPPSGRRVRQHGRRRRRRAARDGGARSKRWFDDEGQRLRPGRHAPLLRDRPRGTKNADDTARTTQIVLWGKDTAPDRPGARRAPRAPRSRRRRRDGDVAVLLAAAFAGLVARRAPAPTGPRATCAGYFASTAGSPGVRLLSREPAGRENVGHSFHFLEAFAATGRLEAAQDEVLVADATPDVPLRSSDVYMRATRAPRRPRPTGRRVAAAGIDALSATTGVARSRAPGSLTSAWPRSHRRRVRHLQPALAARARRAEATRIDAMVRLSRRPTATPGGTAQESLAREPLALHRRASSSWKDASTTTGSSSRERAPEIEAIAAELLPAMTDAAEDRPGCERALRHARARTRARAKEIGYRMEVRQGVVLRMRAPPARHRRPRLSRHARRRPEERATYQALRDCENLEIPPTPPRRGPSSCAPIRFPVLADDVALADSRAAARGSASSSARWPTRSRTEKHLAGGRLAR